MQDDIIVICIGLCMFYVGGVVFGKEMLLIVEIDQGVQIFDCFDNNIVIVFVIIVIGVVIFDVFFVLERYIVVFVVV